MREGARHKSGIAGVMWGRLAACAAVGYRRCPVQTRGVPSGSGRLPIGRSLPSCPTRAPLPCVHLRSDSSRFADESSRRPLLCRAPPPCARATECPKLNAGSGSLTDMRYWAWFAAKLAVSAAGWRGLLALVSRMFPPEKDPLAPLNHGASFLLCDLALLLCF